MRPLALAGAAAGGWAAMCIALRTLLRRLELRTNYRGSEIPGAAGVLLVVSVVFGAAVALAVTDEPRAPIVTTAAAVSMGILGWVDDRWGRTGGGGFAGHLRALARGKVTTGTLKAIGGGAVGLVAAGAVGHDGWWILVAGAVAALATNAVNLVDLRPGRALKVWLLGAAGLGLASPGLGVACVLVAIAGGVVAFLPADLGERAMLGDAGANLLGAAAGVSAVATLGQRTLLGVGCGLIVLTVASEFVSFGAVIERVRPLRAVDRLGRDEPPAA